MIPIRLYGPTFILIALSSACGSDASGTRSLAQEEESSTFVQQFRRDFLIEMNRARAEARACGVRFFRAARPVAYNEKLNTASQLYAQDMAARGFFSHTSPEGQGVRDRLKNVQYRSCTWGENIAWGKVDARRVVAMWVNSAGHCANLMSANFDEIGFGVKEGNAPGSTRKTLYFALNFGRTGPCLDMIEPEIIEPSVSPTVEPTPEPSSVSPTPETSPTPESLPSESPVSGSSPV